MQLLACQQRRKPGLAMKAASPPCPATAAIHHIDARNPAKNHLAQRQANYGRLAGAAPDATVGNRRKDIVLLGLAAEKSIRTECCPYASMQ
jgi:hypothetical protein